MLNKTVMTAARQYAQLIRDAADEIERELNDLERSGEKAITPTKRNHKPATIKTTAPAKRAISAEGRKRIADAQKKRWAAHKGANA
jgi:hypothetical protein